MLTIGINPYQIRQRINSKAVLSFFTLSQGQIHALIASILKLTKRAFSFHTRITDDHFCGVVFAHDACEGLFVLVPALSGVAISSAGLVDCEVES